MEPDSLGPRRRAVADAVGLGFMPLVLLDYLRPSLLLLPTVTAGGDPPYHYPTFVWFHEHLLPHGRLHGWYPGAYLGQPLLLYYFPLPFLAMSALAPLAGLPVAFKLGTVLGVFLLPLLAYASLRLMGFRFPAPAAHALGRRMDLLLRRPLDHGLPAQPLPAAVVAALRGRRHRVDRDARDRPPHGRGRPPLALPPPCHGRRGRSCRRRPHPR